MLNLDDKQYWGDSQYINYWWSSVFAVWEELPELEDRCFSKWLFSNLQTHGILDSNSKWYMSRDGEIEEEVDDILKHYPPIKPQDALKLPPQTDVGYRTEFITGTNWCNNSPHYHYLMYYKHKDFEVIEFFFDCYPDSGYALYFVRNI
jgi:hypothetical protein